MNKLPFILLAGSPKERDSLMSAENVDFKAFIEIKGKPMINYILDAIAKTDIASYILIIGPPKEMITLPEKLEDIVEFVEMEGSQADKVHKSALKLLEVGEKKNIFFDDSYHFIHITADIPAITADLIVKFHQTTIDHDADFYYPIVSQSVMDAKFPNNGRTYIHIEDKYAGADIIKIDAKILASKYDKIKLVTENRKSFMKGLLIASPITLIKYILKIIKLKDAERLMSKILDLQCKLVVSEDAEIGFDIDKPYQLDIMREYFEKLD